MASTDRKLPATPVSAPEKTVSEVWLKQGLPIKGLEFQYIGTSQNASLKVNNAERVLVINTQQHGIIRVPLESVLAYKLSTKE